VAGASCPRARPVRLSQSSEQDARATLVKPLCGGADPLGPPALSPAIGSREAAAVDHRVPERALMPNRDVVHRPAILVRELRALARVLGTGSRAEGQPQPDPAGSAPFNATRSRCNDCSPPRLGCSFARCGCPSNRSVELAPRGPTPCDWAPFSGLPWRRRRPAPSPPGNARQAPASGRAIFPTPPDGQRGAARSHPRRRRGRPARRCH
jgi:hypothetical protein